MLYLGRERERENTKDKSIDFEHKGIRNYVYSIRSGGVLVKKVIVVSWSLPLQARQCLGVLVSLK